MSKLVALVFEDQFSAEEARAALHRMGGEGLLEIDETALIVKDRNEKMQISQDINVVGKDQKVGHVVGLITAAITGTLPLIFTGTLGGRLVGKITDHGITNKFIKEVEKRLHPGTSALIVLTRSDPERKTKVIERLSQWDPHVLETDLSPELEQDLQETLEKGTVVH